MRIKRSYSGMSVTPISDIDEFIKSCRKYKVRFEKYSIQYSTWDGDLMYLIPNDVEHCNKLTIQRWNKRKLERSLRKKDEIKEKKIKI